MFDFYVYLLMALGVVLVFLGLNAFFYYGRGRVEVRSCWRAAAVEKKALAKGSKYFSVDESVG